MQGLKSSANISRGFYVESVNGPQGENWKINSTTQKSFIYLTFIANNKPIDSGTGCCFPCRNIYQYYIGKTAMA